MIYLVSKGLSLFEVGLLEGIFHVTSFLMETPTGAVADIFGRKVSRLVGVVFSIIGGLLMIISHSFAGFAISFIITALSYDFESGAGEALIYDSLKLSNKEKLFMKITGKNEMIYNATSVIAILLGGVVGTIEYLWVFWIGIFISVITLITGLFFKEPRISKAGEIIEHNISHSSALSMAPLGASHSSNESILTDSAYEEKSSRLNVMGTIKAQYVDSINVIRTSKKLAYLIVFSSLLGMFVTLSFFYLQVFWKSSGFIEWQIGMILSVSYIAGMAGAFFAEKIDRKYGEVAILKIAPFLIVIGLLLFNKINISIFAFTILCFVDSVIYVSIRDYINKLIPSEKRATILSFESMMFSFFMILLFPIFGFVSDLITMPLAFLILGTILLVLSLINVHILSKGINIERRSAKTSRLSKPL